MKSYSEQTPDGLTIRYLGTNCPVFQNSKILLVMISKWPWRQT